MFERVLKAEFHRCNQAKRSAVLPNERFSVQVSREPRGAAICICPFPNFRRASPSRQADGIVNSRECIRDGGLRSMRD
jgi:hypothetical protein